MAIERAASTPEVGAARDAVRTLVGFGVAWILVKMVGAEMAATLSGPVEAGIVVVTSALFAWLGKKLRDRGSVAGNVV